MTKEDIRKGVVLYARMLKKTSVYEVCELSVRTVEDDYFVGTDKHDKHAYLFSYNTLDKTIFLSRTKCLDVVLDAEKNAPRLETYYEN